MYIVNELEGYTFSQYLPANQYSYEITRNYILDNGSYYGERTFSFKVVAETIDPVKFIQDMSRWLDTTEFKPLIFSREPYKQYYAKRYGEFSPMIHGMYVVCTLQFIALDYRGYSTFLVSEIDDSYLYDSDYQNAGIKRDAKYRFTNINSNTTLNVHHGGNNDDCKPVIVINGTFHDIVLKNITTGEQCILNYELNNGTLTIDCENQTIFKNDSYDVSGHKGDFISLKGCDNLFVNRLGSYEENDGTNQIQISSKNGMNISEIQFEFRFVYN